MSTMVERVARALCEKHYAERFGKPAENSHVKMNVDGNWHLFIGAARAAIEAMMEPSDEMLDKMNDVWVDAGEVAINVCFEDLRDLFRVGIQAALKENA